MLIRSSDRNEEKALGFGLTTANMFVWHLGGELRFKSFPWFKTEAIFSIPIHLEVSRKKAFHVSTLDLNP